MSIVVGRYKKEWPRSHQFDLWLPFMSRPLFTLFRNPDAGITFRGFGLSIGPGQCGERTWNRETNDVWCYRPFGHDGPHAEGVKAALEAANR